MSCCGKARNQFQAPHVHSRGQPDPLGRPIRGVAPPGKVVFEYRGPTRLVAIGPVSRMRYYFDGHGARADVDPRDRRGLAALAQLRQVT